MRTFWRLLGFLRPYRRGVTVSFVLAAAAMGVSVLVPYLVGRTVDDIRGDAADLELLGGAGCRPAGPGPGLPGLGPDLPAPAGDHDGARARRDARARSRPGRRGPGPHPIRHLDRLPLRP